MVIMRYILIISLIFFTSCKMLEKNKNEAQAKQENSLKIKKKTPTNNMKERILERENGGIFNSAKQRKSGNTYDFATSNVLWRASLESLDFMPLSSVNYSGGVIVTDWYSGDLNSNESIKIEIRFLSSELKASSFKVKSYNKICKNSNCKIANGSKRINDTLKDKIIAKARDLKIKDELAKDK